MASREFKAVECYTNCSSFGKAEYVEAVKSRYGIFVHILSSSWLRMTKVEKIFEKEKEEAINQAEKVKLWK
ncbi:hypothetical protein [Clostridium botulinum]|uniref:Uncharacterized protein n=1 Tax=Clostridium botulinum TaxID=1491 RepID=A0A1L7JMF6_CLOBO|nr:hypothetical protein [Clostridium botulinum]APU86916.1 hypothetical protein NPD8_3805 [Clostridium botulinum]